MTDYVYSVADDMPNGKVNTAHLSSEIEASSIETTLLDINTSGGSVAWGVTTGGSLTISFDGTLTSAEKTTLDGDTTDPAGGLLAAHDNNPTPMDQYWQGVVGANEQFAKLSDAIAAGCTSIYMKNGTYVETSDIVLPNTGGIAIRGETPGGVTIVLVGSARVVLDGCGGTQESTGTVSVTNGSATVTGSGTTFTNLQPEWWIKVQGIYLHIASIESDTSLTLKAPYQGRSLAGQDFIAHKMCAGMILENLMLYKPTAGTGVCLYMRSVNHGVIRDCLVSGKTTSSHGIHMLSCTESFILSTVVQRCGGNGVFVEKSSMAQVSACGFKQNLGDGIEFNDSQNCVVDQTISVMNDIDGIHIANNTSAITVTDSIIRLNNGVGVNTEAGTSACVMDSCVVEQNGSHGIDFNGDDNVVSACLCLANGGDGIQGGSQGAISGCQVNDNTGGGIILTNDKRTTVSGCRVRNNGGIGLDIGSVADDCCVTGSFFRGNGGEGLKCAGDRCTIQGNRIYDNANEGIEIVSGATNCIVLGNAVTGNGTAQISDSGTGTIVEHNITS